MSPSSSRLVLETFDSPLVAGPLEFAALLPPGYDLAGPAVPLLYFLHGGGGDRSFLGERVRPLLEALWAAGEFPRAVVVTPSARRSFYLDYRDGSQRWETLLLGSFLQHLRATFNVRTDAAGTLLAGVSMGGLGSLRMAFKHPHLFRAVAAFEPGIDPVLHYADLHPRYTFYRGPQLMESLFGRPLDPAYWEANNPANIALANATAIRDSGIAIYFEAGDQDFFNLHHAAEFLHRLLWDNGVDHEYHLVRWAEHVGLTVPPRIREGLRFLARSFNPPGPDEAVRGLYAQLGALKASAEASS